MGVRGFAAWSAPFCVYTVVLAHWLGCFGKRNTFFGYTLGPVVQSNRPCYWYKFCWSGGRETGSSNFGGGNCKRGGLFQLKTLTRIAARPKAVEIETVDVALHTHWLGFQKSLEAQDRDISGHDYFTLASRTASMLLDMSYWPKRPGRRRSRGSVDVADGDIYSKNLKIYFLLS